MIHRLMMSVLLIGCLITCSWADLPKNSSPLPFMINTSDQSLKLPNRLRTSTYQPARPVVVVVDKSKHLTHVLQMLGQEDPRELVEVLSIPNATGKPSTPTPDGRRYVISKEPDPTWIPTPSVDPLQRPVGPYSQNHINPLGLAWIGLSDGDVGMHGTSSPSSIGHNASHGCIRHRNEDILKLYHMVSYKTAVYLVEQFAGSQILVSDLVPAAPDFESSKKSGLNAPPVSR